MRGLWVVLVLCAVAAASDPLCCSSTNYASNWQYCNSAAGQWGVSSCSTCESYQCIDWSVGSILNQERESSFYNSTGQRVYFGVGSYGNDQTRAGKCYRITASGIDRDLIVQVVNQGGDVPDGNFDLQMGDGGFGAWNACTNSGTSVPQFDGSSSQWGNEYGGWYTRDGCYNLPQWPHCNSSGADNLQTLCLWSFDRGFRNGNPTISKMCEVKCPSQLVAATGVHRSDEISSVYTCTTGIVGGGSLTRMMDCAKPSYGWPGNLKGSTYPGYEVVVPCRRDGYTRINKM